MNENLVTIKTAIVAAGTALGAFLGWKGVMLIAWVVAMGLDFITGMAAACKAGEWASSVARKGIWHKGGMIAVVLVSAIADWIMVLVDQYLPIGIQWPGIILPLVLAWYIITELGSILENAVKMGAKVPAWLIKLLQASAHIVENAGDMAADPNDEPDGGELNTIHNE